MLVLNSAYVEAVIPVPNVWISCLVGIHHLGLIIELGQLLVISSCFARDNVLFGFSPVRQEIVADSRRLVFLGVPLFNKLVDSDKVGQSKVELLNAVVGLAMLRKILHVLLCVYVTSECGSESGKGCEGSHLAKIIIKIQ